MTRTCPTCDQEVADLARFCSNCGTALVDLSTDSPQAATGTMDVPVGSTGPLGTAESGSLGAVAPGKAMLIVRSGPSEGTSFLLTADTTSIGRADSADVMDWLTACGVTAMSGPMTGVPVDEDEMIRDCLVRER